MYIVYLPVEFALLAGAVLAVMSKVNTCVESKKKKRVKDTIALRISRGFFGRFSKSEIRHWLKYLTTQYDCWLHSLFQGHYYFESSKRATDENWNNFLRTTTTTLGSIGHYFEEQVHFNIPFQYIFLFLTYQRSNFGLLHDLLKPLITQHMGKNCIVNVKNCYGELWSNYFFYTALEHIP